MSDDVRPRGEVRRFFIGATTTRAPGSSRLEDRAELAAALARMAALFTAQLGYTHVPGFGCDLSKETLRARLRSFLTDADRRASDIVTFYYTGHGLLDRDDLLLPMHDATDDLVGTALWLSELTTWLLRGTVTQRFLIILDTCFAAAGGAALAQAGIEHLAHLKGIAANPAVAVVAAARPYEQAESGAFTQAFADAVGNPASSGHEPEFVPLDAIVNMIKMNTPPWQNARLFSVGDGISEFLPNPRFDRWLRDLDLRTQRDKVQRQARAAEQASHVLPRAQGLDRQRDGLWLFAGRDVALRRLSEWLRDVTAAPVLVVTGNPGSGKSAVLSRLHVLADHRLRNRMPGRGDLPVDTIPPVGSIARFIHARGQTPQQVLAGLCEAAGVATARTAGDFLVALARRPDPVTIVIDALDEASSTSTGSNPLVDELLAALVQGASHTRLRLLLGTRRNLLKALGNPPTIDLDEPMFLDSQSLRRYAEHCLTRLVETSPYRLGDELTTEVAIAIATAAGSSYLVAQTAARSLALRERVVDPADSLWRQGLPSAAAAAMRADLEDRLGADAGKARDLLLPLAYAQGAGLPWEDLWSLLASALAKRTYTNEDIDWLIEHAGYYVVESADERRSAYRLYHETLAEHLRQGRDTAADHRVIVEALTQHTPRMPDGQREWSRAHPYTRTHLSTHAARAKALDPLLADPRFLLASEQPQLLAALAEATTPEGKALSDVYRRTAYHLRNKPPEEHAAYLQLIARCGHVGGLAQAVSESGLHVQWRTAWVSWRLQQQHQTFTGHTGEVTSLATAELAGRPVVVSGSADCSVRVWDLALGQIVSDPCVGHTHVVTSVATVGQTIVSGSADGTVRLWDLATGAPIGKPLLGHTDAVNAVAAWQNYVVSASEDRTLRVWNLATGECRSVTHELSVKNIVVAELDGNPLVISTDTVLAQVWSLTTLKPLEARRSASTAMAGAKVAGRPIIATAGLRETQVWDLAERQEIARHSNYIGTQALAVTTLDDRAIAVHGCHDRIVRVADLMSGEEIIPPLFGHSGIVRAVTTAELHGELVVVSGSADHSVRVWNLSGSADNPFSGRTRVTNTLAATTLDGRSVAVTGNDIGVVQVWDLATGSAWSEPIKAHRGAVKAVTTAKWRGRHLAVTAGVDGNVRAWDLSTSAAVGEPFAGHTGPVNAVAMGEIRGRPVVVSGSSDWTVQISFLASSLAIGSPLAGHSGAVNAIAVAGGAIAISASADGTLRVWGLSNAEPIGDPLIGHTDSVNAVAAWQGYVVSGSDDRTVRVWDLETINPCTSWNARTRFAHSRSATGW